MKIFYFRQVTSSRKYIYFILKYEHSLIVCICGDGAYLAKKDNLGVLYFFSKELGKPKEGTDSRASTNIQVRTRALLQ